MKRVLQTASICILALGLIFGRYIGRWLVNVFDNPDTSINAGHLYINQYLSKCDTITLNVKDFKESRSFFEVKAKFNPSSSDNTAFAYKHEIKFYSDALHKYFSIFYFSAILNYIICLVSIIQVLLRIQVEIWLLQENKKLLIKQQALECNIPNKLFDEIIQNSLDHPLFCNWYI